MSELLPTAAERDTLVVEVLEDYLAALEAGTAPSRQEFLAQHPDLAEQLEACLASLDFIRRAGVKSAAPRRTSEPLADGLLGDYRIVREIGRGGMGIVYEAEQRSQRRRVALKVLPFAAALDPRQLQRFKNEAQAASLLQHPHIVPVLDVGCEHGVYFYVMPLIDGRNLAALIDTLRQQTSGPGAKETRPGDAGTDQPATPLQPLGAPAQSVPPSPCRLVTLSPCHRDFFRTVANLGLQAAEALEQAHQVGILHRDVKPANLLVNDQGHLWVTDFGLARFENEASLTLTGDLLGTLRYMSPEQALGRRGVVDQRSDVYSLGLTLYELLTLQPAFGGRDREELLRRIAQDEPTAPRRLNPAIPRDLETIVRKAGAKDPAERYLAAAELADDLRRFLDNQRIQAQPPSLVDRARRWVRRHQDVVACGVAILGVVLVALAVSTFLIARQRDEARRRERQARLAVDEMYTEVAQRWWSQQPYMEPVQREFLLKALRFYEEFAAEGGTDPVVRLEAARAARRVGDIQHRLGETTRAAAAYQQARARLERLQADIPGLAGCREELAQVHNNLGNLLRDTGHLPEAVEAYHQARTLFAAQVAEDAATAERREGLAGSCNNLGMALHALGCPQEAEEVYRQALDAFTDLARSFPQVPRYQHDLASTQTNLANLLRDTGRPQEAQVAYEQALAGWQELRTESPGTPVFAQAQAAGYSGLGILLTARGSARAAEHAQRRALALRERLVQDYPSVPAYRQAVAASRHSLGRLLAGSGRTQEARALYDQAVIGRRQLRDEFPAASPHRQELADSLQGRGQLLVGLGQLGQAEKDLNEALELRQALAAESPQVPEPRWDLARSQQARGDLLWQRGSVREAEQAFREALALEEKLVAESPRVPTYRLGLAATRNELGTLLLAVHRPAEAESAHRAALALRTQLAEQYPRAPYYRYELALGHRHLADLLQRTGRPGEARQAHGQVLALAEKLIAEFPTVPEYRTLLADSLARLGTLLVEQTWDGLGRARFWIQ
jgi:serine/threonine protein kinase